MKKNDIILVIVVLALACGLFFVVRRNTNTAEDPDQVVVYVGGVETERFPLHTDRTYVIESTNGENTLEIKDGEAYISDADCSDKICEYQSAISKNGEMIVCLPHQVLIQIESSDASTTDSVAN